MKTVVRAMVPADARKVASIEVRSWQTAYRGILDPRTLREMAVVEQTRRWLRRLRDGRDRTLVCRSGKDILGYSTIGPCTDRDMERGFAGEIFALYVDPVVVGQGIGRTLLSASFAVLERDGFLWGVVWVLDANDPAQRFYERFGLEADGASRRTRVGRQRLPIVRYARPLNALDLFALNAADRAAT